MARLGEGGSRRGRGFLPGGAQRDPLVPDERVDEELRRPVQGLVRPVLRAKRIGALDAAPKPGVATGAVLRRLEKAEHRPDGTEPFRLARDLEQAQPDVRHLRLAGQAAPRYGGLSARGAPPPGAGLWLPRGPPPPRRPPGGGGETGHPPQCPPPRPAP